MIKMKSTRKRLILAVALLPILLLCAQAFGQNAGVNGTVTDTTGAVLPGATVTATNIDTTIKTTTTSNNAGIFNFAALPAGNYEVSAEIPGFQTSRKTDVKLGVGARIRLNFEMQVAGIATSVEVSTSAADLLLESTATTGTVMSDKVAKDLPLIGNDVLGLVNVMGGVVKAENTIFGNSDQTFAGVLADNINITRDGISVSDARYSSGLVTPSRMNPEMVGEFKVILTPVDAELGRGAGQIQVLTKSGGNEYHGSGVWSNINTGLDAEEWDSKRQNALTEQQNTLPENQANPIPVIEPMYKNVNQYTISGGGPIIKNKTFFFASWDQNIVRKRETVRSNVMTNCAKKGIYRYWPGWVPSNADDTPSYPANAWSTGTYPSVNYDGTPRQPAANPNRSTPYTIVPAGVGGAATAEGMHLGSVFGPLSATAVTQLTADPVNCSQYAFNEQDKNSSPMLDGAPWNALRGTYDTSGYVANFNTIMPKANYFNDGDGLNQAALLWTRTTKGEDTVYGSGMDSTRKSISVKIDHNLSQQHRLSGTYSYEKNGSNGENENTWPVDAPGFGGYLQRKPQTFTVSLTSTLKPTLLNEFRFGLAYNYNRTMSPLNNPETGDAAREFLAQITTDWATDAPWKGLPVLVNPGTGITGFGMSESNPYGGRYDPPGTWGGDDWRWTIADTLTWTKGSHSFKFGGDLRLTKALTVQDGDPNGFTNNWFPLVLGGSATNSPPSGLSTAAARAAFPGLVGSDQSPYGAASGNYTGIYNIMDYMAGSVATIRQFYYINDKSATSWSDPTAEGGQERQVRAKQNEFSMFFKDDWKVTSDLTLNLGIRYEYYGVPWILNGMTQGVVGGSENIFGGTTGGFDEWLQPIGDGVPAFNENNLTQWEFIGPDSDNPDRMLVNRDSNNFGPAVGFAYQLPWFGKGKTTLRGGYQVSYVSISRMGGGMIGAAGSQPGTLYNNSYIGSTANPYLNLAGLQSYLPTSTFFNANTPQPLQIRPITDGTQAATVYDPDVKNPYIQSLTMALTRQIGSSLTIDVRYIGTLSRKQIGTKNLNANNWVSNGLKDAFNAARAGQSSALLDDLYNNADGATTLRNDFFLNASLATGDYNAVASVLATSNGSYPVASGVQSAVIQNSGLGANFVRTNPQFSSANWVTNRNHTNYHSMQAQATLRPTHGLSFTTTYTWSRDLGVKGDGTDPLDYGADYGVLGGNRKHALTSYGTYNLPLGGRDSSGWVKRLAEGWQLSWVYSASSGLPYSVTQTSSMWGGSGVDLVRPDLFDQKNGHVAWGYEVPGTKTALNPVGRIGGTYYGNYMTVSDPQCANVTTLSSLQTYCGRDMKALAVVDHYVLNATTGLMDPVAGPIVFQHAAPGTRGNFDTNSLVSQGRWSLDMAVSKNVTITEGKTVNFRVDIANILNHATPSGTAPFTYDQRTYSPGNPLVAVNGVTTSSPFGYLGYKVGHRVFSCKLQFRF